MSVRILLADADVMRCEDWKALLLDQGYEVIAADTGRAAISICPQIQPDLVLLSDVLPDMNGIEVCRRLKDDPRNHLTPVVLIAAPDSATDPSKAFESGADDFWGLAPTRWDALSRVHSLLQLKTYVDDQAESVIFSLARSVEARDRFSEAHCVRVSNNSVRLGKSLGLNPENVEILRIAGLVHDIGKIAVPDAILSKPGPLNQEETKLIEQHPVIGEHICAPLKCFRDVLPIIRQHHERLDGSGYPDGLKGDQIPLTTRIVQIVDICDALTSDRAYRGALSLPSALMVLYEEAERGWLDEELVTQFSALVLGSDLSTSLGNRRRATMMERIRSSESRSQRSSIL
jgi:putative two-component system response regulator